jgi:hypothetical protein
LITFCSGIFTCAFAQSPEEDLSETRPKYIVDTTFATIDTSFKPLPVSDLTTVIDSKLDSIHQFNQGIYTAEGYRILVYHGSSSEESLQACNSINTYWPSFRSYPEWRVSFHVKVGDFLSKTEAYHVLSDLQKSFPKAILVPDIVNIRMPDGN